MNFSMNSEFTLSLYLSLIPCLIVLSHLNQCRDDTGTIIYSLLYSLLASRRTDWQQKLIKSAYVAATKRVYLSVSCKWLPRSNSDVANLWERDRLQIQMPIVILYVKAAKEKSQRVLFNRGLLITNSGLGLIV